MADLATQQLDLDGVEPTYAAAAGGGDTFTPGDEVFVHVKNGDASSHDITIVTPGTVAGQAVGDVTVAVPAGEDRFIGPLPSRYFGRASDGKGDITWSDATGMTVAVLRA